MKELRDKTQETGRRFPTPQPTRAQAENFALFVASKLERGVTTEQLIGGEYEGNSWFAYCPAVLRCGIMPLIDKAEADLRHWFIVEEEMKPRASHKTYRFRYDFEKGRFDMATIRKLTDDKKAAAADDEKKADAAAKKAEAAEADDEKKTNAAAKKAEAAEAKKAAVAVARAAKAAEPKEKAKATLVLQRSIGGMFIGELRLADGEYKYFDMRRSLPSLFDAYQKICGETHHIVKIDTKAAELTTAEKKELKAWGSFE